MAGTGLGSFIQYAVMPPVLLLNRLQMAITAPEKYGVVAVGCELMQFWTTIEEDMLPIPVANHALAGSSSADLVSAVDFQVTDHEPRVVIYWGGSNDIARGATPSQTAGGFTEFSELVLAKLPDVQILFVSILRSPYQEGIEKGDDVDRTNELTRKFCDSQERCTFLDINSIFQNGDGSARKEMYQFFDRHNLTSYAYDEISRILQIVLKRLWDKAGGEALEHLASREEEEMAGGEKEL